MKNVLKIAGHFLVFLQNNNFYSKNKKYLEYIDKQLLGM
jgi:hypothetical protein